MITAGVLAGIWPCGVVTMLEEIFRAQAKCQVQYMAASTAFSTNPTETSTISKINGCTVLVFYIVLHVYAHLKIRIPSLR